MVLKHWRQLQTQFTVGQVTILVVTETAILCYCILNFYSCPFSSFPQIRNCIPPKATSQKEIFISFFNGTEHI